MKRITITGIILLTLFLSISSSCKEDKEDALLLDINDDSLDLGSSPSSGTIEVTTNYSDWNFQISDDGTEWCTATKQQNKLLISATENTNLGMRQTVITVRAGQLSQPVTVRQLGIEPAILVTPDNISVKAEGETIELKITANIEYQIEGVPSWIKEIPLVRAVEMVTTTHKYTVERNRSDGQRTAFIQVKDKKEEPTVKKEVQIIQTGEKYEAEGESGIADDIKIKVTGAKSDNQQSGQGIELSFDGDINTLYHSRWNNGTKETNPDYFPITLDYYFDNEESIDYIFYYPRSSGSNGLFKETEIWVETTAVPGFTKIMDKDFGGISTPTRVAFESPLCNVKTIRFVVNSGAGDNQGFASCAEMEFYRKNSQNFDPLTLFTDVSCTELKSGITEKEIDECAYPFFRNIAYYMLVDKYPREFRISGYKPYPHPDAESKINKTGTYSLLDNPTGIAVKSGEELIIMVGKTFGRTIGVRIQDLDVPGGDGFNSADNYPLTEGINKIKVRKGGLLYIMYHTPDYRTAPAITIHIASGTINGYFDSTKHTASGDWERLLNNATNKYFDVLGEYAHLTFPTHRFRNHTGKKGKELIDAYDRLVYLEMEFMGLEKYDRMFNNRMYFSVIYTSYMYAAGYHTAYNDDTLAELCNVDLLKTTAIWGPAHEVGHINQTRPGLKWVGTTEVTNNIHSMYVQREFGNPTRLQTESMVNGGGFTNRYEKAMNLYFRSGRPHCYMTKAEEQNLVDVFCKLVPFWQLQLYVADARGNNDFYKDLYQIVREEEDKKTEAEHQLEFVVRACKAAKLNLLDFFQKWGFLTEVDVEVEDYSKARMKITSSMIEDTKKRVVAMGYPEPAHNFEYICDKNVNIFKSTASTGKGTARRNGKTLIMSGWTNVAAFEVRDGERLVFVSPEANFTLDNTISSWNSAYKVYAISSTGERLEVTLQ